MFELNSIRELNHRLSRLMDLSAGQKQYMGGEKANYFSPTNDNKPNNTLEASESTQGNYGFPTHMNLELTKNNSTQNSLYQQNSLLLDVTNKQDKSYEIKFNLHKKCLRPKKLQKCIFSIRYHIQ